MTMVQVFLSHTKLHREFCDRFDSVAPRAGLKVFRSEFEEMQSPNWKTIRDEINKSCALFLLVGKELVKAQTSSESDLKAREDWKHTQNWISYEVGLACQRGIDVWVVCDSVNINFPVPYLNNFDIWGINRDDPNSLKVWRGFFEHYISGKTFPVIEESSVNCPKCGAFFNLRSQLPVGIDVPCPTCLKVSKFPKGWPLPKT